MSLTLRVTALKIINYGGGTMYRVDKKKQTISQKTDRGSDYVVFRCPVPKCDRVQKRCMYEMENYKPANEDCVPFKCKWCRNIIEVQRPIAHGLPPLIVSPEEYNAERANRSHLSVDRTKLVRP